jgi:hypothetical protein
VLAKEQKADFFARYSELLLVLEFLCEMIFPGSSAPLSLCVLLLDLCRFLARFGMRAARHQL